MALIILAVFNSTVFFIAYKISDTFWVGAVTGILISAITQVVLRVREELA